MASIEASRWKTLMQTCMHTHTKLMHTHEHRHSLPLSLSPSLSLSLCPSICSSLPPSLFLPPSLSSADDQSQPPSQSLTGDGHKAQTAHLSHLLFNLWDLFIQNHRIALFCHRLQLQCWLRWRLSFTETGLSRWLRSHWNGAFQVTKIALKHGFPGD